MGKLCFTVALFVFVSLIGRSQTVDIDWPSMMDKQDIVNTSLTHNWSDGLFTGNGLLGTMAYLSQDDGALRVDVGRTDVYDHRADKKLMHLYSHARLSIGHFLLRPVGKILGNDGRLRLWNAEATGTIITEKGKIEWRVLTMSEKNIILLDYNTTGEEGNFEWTWVPEKSESPRVTFKAPPNGSYIPNPIGSIDTINGVSVYWQPLLAGGGYATAWKRMSNSFLISIGYDTSGSNVRNELATTLNTITEASIGQNIEEHRYWWHQYYKKSFLSVPDTRMQSFYWIQLYKMGSATRSGKPALDLQGPWTANTPWPGYWFNLNIQLAYSPMYTSNHLEIASSLMEMLDKNKENLALNVPKQYRNDAIAVGRAGAPNMLGSAVGVTKEGDTAKPLATLEMGNLNWMLYYYWKQYRYSMDQKLKKPLSELLRRSTRYFLDVANRDKENFIHLPYTYSPEYPGGPTRDCNYSLSLFKWSCQTLLKLNPEDREAFNWKDVVDNLTPYPTDSTGFRVGSDIGFTKSHRHFSHLLMIYPLQMINWEQENNRGVIAKSLETWQKNRTALQGYSFTGGASIYAMMGNGDQAYKYLNILLDKFVKNNTMYLESGPVIETPLSAAQSMLEMAVQCRDDKIFIFHAVPKNWKNMDFMDFRTEGAFLVSGVLRNGEIQWIKIKSIVGGTFNIVCSMKNPKILLNSGDTKQTNISKDGVLTWTVTKGESVVIYSDKRGLKVALGEVDANGKHNSWGNKKN